MTFTFFKMPDWGPLLVGVWAFVSFIVWYLYRHAIKKYRVGFKVSFLLISALFFFILLFNWVREQTQSNPLRIVVFPFISQSDTPLISWESLAFSGLTIRYLEQFNLDQILPYQLDWVISAANRDSMISEVYQRDFSKRIATDYIVLGESLKESSGFLLSYQLWDVKRNKVLFEGNKLVKLVEVQEFSRGLSFSIANRVLESTSDVELKDRWRSVEQIRSYYEFKHSFLNGDLTSAFRLARGGVKKDSNSTTLLNSLAEIYLNRGAEKEKIGQNSLEDFQAAKALLQKSATWNGQASETSRLLAELYLTNERWSRAEEYLRESLSINPWDSKTYVDLTQLHSSRYADLGFDNEDELLEQAIFVNPLDFEARLILADNYGQRRRPDLAIKIIKEILRINPNYVNALMKLGHLYVTQNDLLSSLEIYQKVINLEPENNEVYYNLGIAYYHQKDYEMAVKFFEHAIKSVDHVDSHLYLAYIYEQKDEIEQAIKHLRIRIAKRSGREDKFAEEARRHLFQIMSERKDKDSKVSQIKNQN